MEKKLRSILAAALALNLAAPEWAAGSLEEEHIKLVWLALYTVIL